MKGSSVVEELSVTMAAPEARDERAGLLWQEFYGPLAGWVLSLTGDREAAQDITSEAFCRLLARWISVRDPRGYLYVTSLNLVRDQWRKADRARRNGAEDERINVGGDPSDAWLKDVVARLPRRLRDPVLLHYYADLPVRTIALALRRPEGSIKRALSEGRAQLLVMIKEDQA